MFKSRLFKFCSFPLLLAFIVSVAISQSDQPTQSESELPAVTPTPTAAPTDNATLNLHRWGAVTLFHGLPSDRVNAIAEDANGVLWFGTDNGLVRYDGRNVEAAPNESSLLSQRTLALKLDSRGNLWVGTEKGAVRLREGRTEVLDETRDRAVTGVAASPQGEVVLVTDGGEIIRYQEQKDSEYRSERTAQNRMAATKLDQNAHPLLRSPDQSKPTLKLAAISFAASGDWLIGSHSRGLLINRANDLREATLQSPRPYFINSIYNDGVRVWLAEANGRAGGLWSWSNGSLKRASLDAGAITAVHGGDGELWAGTSRRGVFLLRPENDDAKQIEHLTFENTDGGLRSDSINAVFRDREGVIWFGTDRGVCRYDRTSFRASNVSANRQSNYVRVMLRAASGETWCGTNSGLFTLASGASEANSESWVEVGETQGRSIYALSEDASGALWVGTSGGLFVKPKNASGFSRVSSAPNTTITITDESGPEQAEPGEPRQPGDSTEAPQPSAPPARESIRAIATFRGHIYGAVYDRGIERIDVAGNGQNGYTRVPVLTDAAAKHAICFANEGNAALWFGTTDGELRRFDGSQTVTINMPSKQPSAPADHAVRAIAMAGKRIWIGGSHGVYLREGEAIREIRSDIDVWSLIVTQEKISEENTREVVWVAAHNAGLIKMLPDRNVIAGFDTEPGLPSQQVFAVATGAAGEIWAGTNRGVARHRPSTIEPRLQIKRLVAEKIYLPDELTAELLLPHTLRNFTLEVTGLGSKTFPSQFQYEFALLDRNNNEIKRAQPREPQFAVEGLQSGPYTIVARAISRDLVYSDPLSLRLRIRRAPFPWPTLLLASLLAVAVAAAVWAFRQQRRLASTNRTLETTNVELRETRLRLANETEAERSRIARDLHDQTLADLRHLLVLTDQLPSADGDDSLPSPAAIRKEIEAISSEIRHICEDLSPSALENLGFLPALEWALSDAVTHLPAEDKFAYEFICEPELEDRLRLSHIEQIQLYRIVQEALNNISRHAKAKQVRLSVRTVDANDLVIEIRDDGVGFNRARGNRTGHGIANIRSRANLIGARVEWNNARPGCQFEVRKDGCVSRGSRIEDRGSRIED